MRVVEQLIEDFDFDVLCVDNATNLDSLEKTTEKKRKSITISLDAEKKQKDLECEKEIELKIQELTSKVSQNEQELNAVQQEKADLEEQLKKLSFLKFSAKSKIQAKIQETESKIKAITYMLNHNKAEKESVADSIRSEYDRKKQQLENDAAKKISRLNLSADDLKFNRFIYSNNIDYIFSNSKREDIIDFIHRYTYIITQTDDEIYNESFYDSAKRRAIIEKYLPILIKYVSYNNTISIDSAAEILHEFFNYLVENGFLKRSFFSGYEIRTRRLISEVANHLERKGKIKKSFDRDFYGNSTLMYILVNE